MLGARTPASDRFLRTVGFRRAAEAAAARLAPDVRRAFDAYTAGLNAYLAADRARPVELRILRVEVEPFTVTDALAWSRMMAWDLALNATNEIRRAAYAERVGPARAAELFPEVPLTPTILADSEWKGAAPAGAPAAAPAAPGHRAGCARLRRAVDLPAAPGLTGEDRGRKSWPVSEPRRAKRTARPA